MTSTHKVLVTGGAGFIGSHLCQALLERGDEVFVLDDLSTGRIENLDHLQENDSLHVTIGSTSDIRILEPLVRQSDFIFHLAAVVGVRKIIDRPFDAIETNLLGTYSVLSQAARYRTPFLFTSTSEVYGKSSKHPFTEGDDVVYGPTTVSRWSYACSKWIDEFLALAYHRELKLPVVVARLFNTTGPRQTGRYGMVLPRFVDQALRSQPLTVFGDGQQKRCFIDVSDVVRALLLLANHPEAVGQVFNVGNPVETSIYELAQLVKKITGSDSPIRLIPYEEAYQAGFEDIQRRIPSIEKLSRLTGYRPRVELRGIISRVVESRSRGLVMS